MKFFYALLSLSVISLTPSKTFIIWPFLGKTTQLVAAGKSVSIDFDQFEDYEAVLGSLSDVLVEDEYIKSRLKLEEDELAVVTEVMNQTYMSLKDSPRSLREWMRYNHYIMCRVDKEKVEKEKGRWGYSTVISLLAWLGIKK